MKKESLNSSLSGIMIMRDENCKIVPSQAAAGSHVHAPRHSFLSYIFLIPSHSLTLLITHHTLAICSQSARAQPRRNQRSSQISPSSVIWSTYLLLLLLVLVSILSINYWLLYFQDLILNIYKICQLKVSIRDLRRSSFIFSTRELVKICDDSL